MNGNILDIIGAVASFLFGTRFRAEILALAAAAQAFGGEFARGVDTFLRTNYHRVLISVRTRATLAYLVLSLVTLAGAYLAPEACQGSYPMEARRWTMYGPILLVLYSFGRWIHLRFWLSDVPTLTIREIVRLITREHDDPLPYMQWSPDHRLLDLQRNGMEHPGVIQARMAPFAPGDPIRVALEQELQRVTDFVTSRVNAVEPPPMSDQEYDAWRQSLDNLDRSPVSTQASVFIDGMAMYLGMGASICAFAAFAGAPAGYLWWLYPIFALALAGVYFVFLAEAYVVYGSTLAIARVALVNGVRLTVGLIQLLLRGLPGIDEQNIEQLVSSLGDEALDELFKQLWNLMAIFFEKLALLGALIVLLRHPAAIAFSLLSAFIAATAYGHLRRVNISTDELIKRDARRMHLLLVGLTVVLGVQLALSVYAGVFIGLVDAVLRVIDWVVHPIDFADNVMMYHHKAPWTCAIIAVIVFAALYFAVTKLKLLTTFGNRTQHPALRYGALAVFVLLTLTALNFVFGIPHLARGDIMEYARSRYVCPVSDLGSVAHVDTQVPSAATPDPIVPAVVAPVRAPTADPAHAAASSRSGHGHHRRRVEPTVPTEAVDNDGWTAAERPAIGPYL